MSEVVYFCGAFDGAWILLLGFDFSLADDEPYDRNRCDDDEEKVEFVVGWGLVCVKSLDDLLENSPHEYYNSQKRCDHCDKSRNKLCLLNLYGTLINL